MSVERIEMVRQGDCPVCAAIIIPQGNVEETEIVSCPECQTRLVVERLEGSRAIFSEAPQIEEDWGE